MGVVPQRGSAFCRTFRGLDSLVGIHAKRRNMNNPLRHTVGFCAACCPLQVEVLKVKEPRGNKRK